MFKTNSSKNTKLLKTKIDRLIYKKKTLLKNIFRECLFFVNKQSIGGWLLFYYDFAGWDCVGLVVVEFYNIDAVMEVDWQECWVDVLTQYDAAVDVKHFYSVYHTR